MTQALGLMVPLRSGPVEIFRQVPTNYGAMSSFYEGTNEKGERVFVHENIVDSVKAGTYVPEEERVKGPRKVSTKKERAIKHVKECQRKRMTRGETIKLLQQKLRVSRGTAQTYFYAVRNA